MRKIYVTVILLIITLGAYSQDVITRINGDVINCKILEEDSTFVYFKTFVNNKLIETHLPASEISSIKYYSNSMTETDTIVEIENREIVTKSVGIGLDYGGFAGFKITVNLHDNIGILGGVGWAYGLGYNVGTKISFAPKSIINPHFQAMYGKNTVINIIDNSDLSKIYYGGTVGFGIDIKSTHRRSYWTLGLLIPIRNSEVSDYMHYLEDEENVTFERDLSPVLLTIGLNF